MAAYRNFYVADRFSLPQGDLFGYAITLVRAAAERGKPNAERFPGYSDSQLPLVEKRLLDQKPIYPWLDQLMMEWSLSKSREYLGADDPQTKLLLGKESPEGLAARLVAGTKLADPAVRKTLWDGGQAAINASTDPMIVYARGIEANDRRLITIHDEQVEGPLTAARAKLADARFAAYGDTVYPDATFTLRISYGKVAGWMERVRAGLPLVVPEDAVVVPGARAVTVGSGKDWGLSLATPVIVKYRDQKTDARTELERWIR